MRAIRIFQTCRVSSLRLPNSLTSAIHLFSLSFTRVIPKVRSPTYSISRTAQSFRMGSGRTFLRAVQSTLITFCPDTTPPPTMMIASKSWATWSSRSHPLPRARLSALLEIGVSHGTRPFELSSLLFLTEQGSSLGTAKLSLISSGQHMSTSTSVSSLSIVLSGVEWDPVVTSSLRTYTNSSTCEQVIWITSGQPLFIPVEYKHPILHARRVKPAIDGTKDCAPWRTPCVAGCTYATSVRKRVTRRLAAPPRPSCQSFCSLASRFDHSGPNSQFLSFLSILPPRGMLGATKNDD